MADLKAVGRTGRLWTAAALLGAVLATAGAALAITGSVSLDVGGLLTAGGLLVTSAASSLSVRNRPRAG